MSVHDGHRKRMRERVQAYGLASLQQHEVLEFLLYPFIPRKDTNPLAHQLINEFGSLSKVFDASVERLQKTGIIGFNAAVFLSSIGSLSRIYESSKSESLPLLKTTQACFDYIKPKMATLPHEEVRLLCKDNSGKLIKDALISTGSINVSNFYMRDIANQILNTHATSVVLVHNHPSQDCRPSSQDDLITNTVAVALNLIQVRLDDHIIVTQNDCFSYKKSGKLDSFFNNVFVITDGIVKDIER